MCGCGWGGWLVGINLGDWEETDCDNIDLVNVSNKEFLLFSFTQGKALQVNALKQLQCSDEKAL